MKQKVETYINKEPSDIEYKITKNIRDGWLVVTMAVQDKVWIVVYQEKDLELETR